ncbi:MAG: ABC transporter substrate-binding protein [Deltaproteobacteria bacterium]|nr:ABC transporter substrate-binding protein [Deltaproteobacteria bacterium]
MGLRHLFYQLAIYLAACSAFFQPTIVRAEESVSIGILASLSDEWAAVGKNIVRGAEIARDELNSSAGLGKPIRLVIEDTREANSGATAVSAYRNLRQRGVTIFVGPVGAPAGMSLAPIVAKEPVVMITPVVGVRDFSDAAPNIFNARGVDESSSRTMARFAIQRGWKRAGILSSQQPWESAQGNAFRDEFTRLGGVVAALEEPLPDASDLKTPIAKVLQAKPDVIFLSNANRLALAARQIKAAGYEGPKLAALLDQSLVEQSQGTLEGTRFAAFGSPTPDFKQRFADRYKEAPGLGADTGYDAVMAIGLAMKQTRSSSPERVVPALATIQFPGASEPFAFDADRIAKRSLARFIVRDGLIVEDPADSSRGR